MPTEPSEPDKYSIDEMIDRLKHTTSENPADGELVTRPDGTQAVRIRKRKRRTSQPHKKDVSHSRRARIVQVTAVLVLVFIAAFVVGGAVIYANSSLFRKELARNISQTTGASVELEQFRMNPQTANASKLLLQWPEGNVLKSATLSGINAEIFPSSFLGKTLNGEEVSIAQGTLTLQIPKPGQAITNVPDAKEDLPIHFNRYRIPVFNLTLGDPSAPAIRLLKSEVSLNPENVNGRPQMSLYQGALSINGWPKLRLDRALLEFPGKETDVIGLRILHETDDRGAFELSGSVTPYEPENASTLAVSLDSFDMSGIIGPSLARFFTGRIDSTPSAKSNYFTFLPTADPAPVLDVAFLSTPASQIEVRVFPFLTGLAQALDDLWFEHPVFEADAMGKIHRENGIISLRELHFESKGRIALKGEVSLNVDQTLSGNLEVGVAEAMVLSAKSTRLKSLFGPTKDGFRWVTLKIGGQAALPTDNFQELFSAAEQSPGSDQGSTEPPKDSFEELTRPKD